MVCRFCILYFCLSQDWSNGLLSLFYFFIFYFLFFIFFYEIYQINVSFCAQQLCVYQLYNKWAGDNIGNYWLLCSLSKYQWHKWSNTLQKIFFLFFIGLEFVLLLDHYDVWLVMKNKVLRIINVICLHWSRFILLPQWLLFFVSSESFLL